MLLKGIKQNDWSTGSAQISTQRGDFIKQTEGQRVVDSDKVEQTLLALYIAHTDKTHFI